MEEEIAREKGYPYENARSNILSDELTCIKKEHEAEVMLPKEKVYRLKMECVILEKATEIFKKATASI